MALISAHGISKSYGPRSVLTHVAISVEPRDRLGLIGINGAGKSTLIRILIGQETPDAGEVMRKRHLTIGHVEQSPRLDAHETVLDVVQHGLSANLEIARRHEKVSAAIAHAQDDTSLAELLEEQHRLVDEIERRGGWNVEHMADAAMLALSVPPKERRVGSLSLGEIRRVALCSALLSEPDLLILDEPTNHIDVHAIEWLEMTLAEYHGALVLVTHDRYFLDRVANRHAELDQGELRLYDGNYSDYLVQKAEREAIEAKVEHKRRRSIESELAWVRRGAPARTTKQKARLDRFDALVATRPRAAAEEASFRLPHPPRIGKSILETRRLSKTLGDKKLVRDFDLLLSKGDRLGIIGENGAGKTTLLRMILGELEPDSGEVLRGHNTLITYADQRRLLDDDNTVLEEVAGKSDVVFVGDEPISVHSFLSGLLFDSGAQRAKISSLSGGEKSRVALAKALRVSSNLLLLDEPTNDLDLATLRVLEEALVEYPGCALVVSHDRCFLDRVATGILVFEGDGHVVRYEGVTQHQRGSRSRNEMPAHEAKAKNHRSQAIAPRRLSYKERQELVSMEERILAAEARVSGIEQELSDPEAAKRMGPAMKERLAELDRFKDEVEALYARWSDLSAIES